MLLTSLMFGHVFRPGFRLPCLRTWKCAIQVLCFFVVVVTCCHSLSNHSMFHIHLFQRIPLKICWLAAFCDQQEHDVIGGNYHIWPIFRPKFTGNSHSRNPVANRRTADSDANWTFGLGHGWSANFAATWSNAIQTIVLRRNKRIGQCKLWRLH